MNINLNNGVSRIAMTAAERAAGRFMRAPDHPGTEGGTTGLEMPEIEGNEQDGVTDTTAEDLEREFGQVDEPATGVADESKPEGEAGKEGKEGGEEEADPAKPKSDAQTRIDEVTAARREAERQAAEARREADYWRGKAEGAAAPKTEGAAEDVGDQAPDPSKYEFGEADSKFIADLSRYHARQEFVAQQAQASTRAELATMEAGWQDNVGKAAERYPDFKEKVLDTAEKQSWKCPPVIALGIKASDYGPDIAYHLATNTAEADRIAALPTTIEQAREFGRLEGRFEYEARQREQSEQPKPKTTTSAPPPPSGQTRGAGGKFAPAADTDDFSSFERSADAILSKKK